MVETNDIDPIFGSSWRGKKELDDASPVLMSNECTFDRY